MSTNCYVGLVIRGTSVEFIYVHWEISPDDVLLESEVEL